MKVNGPVVYRMLDEGTVLLTSFSHCRSILEAFFVIDSLSVDRGDSGGLKKNLNASRPSEHLPVRGEMLKRLGGIIGCKYKTSSWP